MPIINYTPMFTYIGLNKIAKAITTQELITLSKIHLGDAITDIEYIPTPNDIDIKHKILEIDAISVNYLDLKNSKNAAMRISGTLLPQDSVAFTIREYGVYDTEGDLILIGRIKDSEMLLQGEASTGLEFTINMSLSDTQRAFITNNVPTSDYISPADLTAHISAINPHNVSKEDLLLSNIDNTSDLDKPTHPAVTKMLNDISFAIGFTTRVGSTITQENSVITLTIPAPVKVYKRGVKHSLYGILILDVSNYTGGYYVGYNPIDNVLYVIEENPDFHNDILVTWFYRNSEQGIIWLNDERHSVSRNVDDHRLHHTEIGAVWISGGAMTYVLNDAANNKVSFTTPVLLADEDLNFTIVDKETPNLPYEQNLSNPKLSVLYLGSDMRYRTATNDNTNLNWLYNGTRAVYNDRTLGTLVTAPNDTYVCYWVLFTTDQTNCIKLILGGEAHATLDLAMEEELDPNGLPMPEFVISYKIVLNINDVNSNLAKAKIANVFELANNTRKNSIMSNSHDTLVDKNIAGQHNVDSITGLTEALANAGKIKKIKLTGTFKADATETDINGKITLNAYQSDSRNMPYISDPVFCDFFGTSYVGNVKWDEAILAPNGKIYCVPHDATQVLEIDPIAKTTTLIGTVYANGANGAKWHGGALAPNGKIYCTPHNAGQVLEIDPIAKTTTLIGTNFGSAAAKWFGATLAPNGKIYCMPCNATQVLEIDPIAKTTVLIGSSYSGDYKWHKAALASNGKIYSPPLTISHMQVLEIDPVAKTTTLIGNSYPAGGWAGIALAPDGKLYCAPSGATQVLEIDPGTKTTTLIGNSYIGGSKWTGVVLAPNGKLYCIPYYATQVLEIDPKKKASTLIGVVYGNSRKWHMGCLAPNGKIYCSPFDATQVLEIDTFPKSTDFGKYLLSGTNGQPLVPEPAVLKYYISLDTVWYYEDGSSNQITEANLFKSKYSDGLSMEEMTFNLDGSITYNALNISNNTIVETGDGFLSYAGTAEKRTRWISTISTAPLPLAADEMTFTIKEFTGSFTINGIAPAIDSIFHFPVKIKSTRKNPQLDATSQFSFIPEIKYKNSNIAVNITTRPETSVSETIVKSLIFNSDSYGNNIYVNSPTTFTFGKTGSLSHNGTYIAGTNRITNTWANNWTKQLLYPLYARVRKNGTALGITVNGTALSAQTSANHLLNNDFVLGFSGAVGTYSFYVDIMDDTYSILKTYTVNVTMPEIYSFLTTESMNPAGDKSAWINFYSNGEYYKTTFGVPPDSTNPNNRRRWLSTDNASSLYCRLRADNYSASLGSLFINNNIVNPNGTSTTYSMAKTITISSTISSSNYAYFSNKIYLDIMNASGTILITFAINITTANNT